MYFLVLLLILGLTAQYVAAGDPVYPEAITVTYTNYQGRPVEERVAIARSDGGDDAADGTPTLVLDIRKKGSGFKLKVQAEGRSRAWPSELRIRSKHGLLTRTVQNLRDDDPRDDDPRDDDPRDDKPSERKSSDDKSKLYLLSIGTKFFTEIKSIEINGFNLARGIHDEIYKKDCLLIDRDAFLVVNHKKSLKRTLWPVTALENEKSGFVTKKKSFCSKFLSCLIPFRRSAGRRSLLSKISSSFKKNPLDKDLEGTLRIALEKSRKIFKAVPEEESLDVVPLGKRLLCFESNLDVDYVRYWKAIDNNSNAAQGTEKNAEFDHEPQEYSYELKWSDSNYECGTLTQRRPSDSRRGSSTPSVTSLGSVNEKREDPPAVTEAVDDKLLIIL